MAKAALRMGNDHPVARREASRVTMTSSVPTMTSPRVGKTPARPVRSSNTTNT